MVLLVARVTVTIHTGHVLDVLATLPANSAQSCVTSPPYFNLRAYGTEPQVWGGDPEHGHTWGDPVPGDAKGGSGTFNGRNGAGEGYARGAERGAFCACGAWRGELGSEPDPSQFIANLVTVFRAVRRVLRPDGVLLLNIGDSYAGSGKGQNADGSAAPGGFQKSSRGTVTGGIATGKNPAGAKPKDLLMIPAQVALALRADGWYLRGEYVWAKPACMPESVTDRCTRSHEMIYHLAKSARYFWNADAIRTQIADSSLARAAQNDGSPVWNGERERGFPGSPQTMDVSRFVPKDGANRRSVWTIASQGFPGAHFATFPPALAELMVLATTRPGDTVLDPFLGAGTTALEAERHGRNCVGIELNPEYASMARARIERDAPLFADVQGAAASEAPGSPVLDVLSAMGFRTYAGFNARWNGVA